MAKKGGKGGNARRRGKGDGGPKRELVYKEDGQEYAQVLRMLGNGRLEALCFDNVGSGKKRLCHIRGKMRKKVWIRTQDIILVSLRDFQDEKADVILKYTPDESRILKQEKLIPSDIHINENDVLQGSDMGDIDFNDRGDSDSDDSEVLDIENL